MRVLSLVSLMVLAVTAFSLNSHAEPPAAPSAAQLTPQLQAMLDELLKSLESGSTQEAAPTPPPATATATTSTTGASPSPKISPLQSSLQSGGLRTGGLMTSGSVGGHGRLDGAPRLTDPEWRQLFPVRK